MIAPNPPPSCASASNPRPHQSAAYALLALLTTLADRNEPCPTNDDLAKRLGRARSYATRHLAELLADGLISTKGNGQRRIITIISTNKSTPPRLIIQASTTPSPRPPCAVCGDPVVMKSNKFPRSCDKRSCRASIRYLAYGGTLDALPWPTLGGPIEASFREHNLTFRPDVRRGAGRPMTTSYGVSSAYSSGETTI